MLGRRFTLYQTGSDSRRSYGNVWVQYWSPASHSETQGGLPYLAQLCFEDDDGAGARIVLICAMFLRFMELAPYNG
jgi:hypothetical protein